MLEKTDNRLGALAMTDQSDEHSAVIRLFEKALLIFVVLDLALGGNGYLVKIETFRIREILFALCIPWAVLRLMPWAALRPMTFDRIRLDPKIWMLFGLFMVVTIFGAAFGYFNGSRVGAIIAELKPLGYFPMLFFFLVAIRSREDLTLVAGILMICGTLLAALYLLVLLSANIGLVEFSSIYNFLHVSDEFIFRQTFDSQAPFAGFLYKGAFYICVAAVFLIFDPFKVTKLFGVLTVIAVAMTLTRSLSVGLCVTILAGIALNHNWRRAPMLLGLLGLLVAVMFLGAYDEQDLNDSLAKNCAMHTSCTHSAIDAMRRASDADRVEDIKFIVKELDAPMLVFGRGLGAPIRGTRERIELTYFEVLYKQGIPGLLVWFLLFAYTFLLYWKVPTETRAFGLAFFLSSLFVFISTFFTTFLTGSIGMAVVFISLASLSVLANEKPRPMLRSDWYGASP